MKHSELREGTVSWVSFGQYIFGTEDGAVSPDVYSLDIYYSQTIPDYEEKQADLIYDYKNNVKLYLMFQEYLRTYQPPLLAEVIKNDSFN